MVLGNEFNVLYGEFVSAWLEHEKLRGSDDFVVRITSRQRLDDMRLRVRAFSTHIH